MSDSIDLSPEALTRLKALAQKATPGPWIDYEGSIYQKNEGCFWIVDVGRTIEDRQEERAYIAAAHPGVLLAMCEEIERLRAQVATQEVLSGEDDACMTQLEVERDALEEQVALLEKEADWLARVCAEQMLEGVNEQSVQWWRKKARGAAEVKHD